MQPPRPVGGHQPLVDRVQGQRLIREPVPRLLQRAEVLVAAAGDVEELLGFRVERLERVVGNGPIPDGARDPVAVRAPGVEVVAARAQEGRAVKRGAAAKDPADVQLLGGAVDLDLAVVVRLLVDEHRLFVVGGAVRLIFPSAFEQQHALAGARARRRQRRTAGAAADHKHVTSRSRRRRCPRDYYSWAPTGMSSASSSRVGSSTAGSSAVSATTVSASNTSTRTCPSDTLKYVQGNSVQHPLLK